MAGTRLKDLELPRAIWHALAISTWGVAALAAKFGWFGFLTAPVYIFLAWWAFAVMLAWEGLRQRYEWVSRAPIVRHLLRKGERHTEYTTAVYFLLALLILVSAFDMRTVAAAIFVTGCSDPAARIIGKAFGKHRFPKSRKTVEGSLACFAVTVLIVWAVSGAPVEGPAAGLVVAAVAGFVVAAAELLIPGFLPGFLDDNFWIPLLCALAIDWTPWLMGRLSAA